MKVLYILMRTDLPSMNAGKAMAQASHASNAFIHAHGKKTEVKEWQKETEQGFGTVLVLGATANDIFEIHSDAMNYAFINKGVKFDQVVDPTYPYIVSSEILPLISDDVHTGEPPKELESGDFVCFRSEVTCAYLFGEKEEIEHLVENLKLHP